MRKLMAAALVAACSVVPVASAEQPASPGKSGEKPAAAAPGKSVKPCKKPPKRGIAYIVRGVVVVAPSATTSTMYVDLTSVNSHAKKALAGPDARGGGAYAAAMIPVKIDRCTFITGNGKHPYKRSYRALKVGDRLVIGWKAKRGTTYLDLGSAQRVVDRGPGRY